MRVSGASADAPRREKNNDRSVPGCRIHPRRRLLQVYISPSFDFFLPSNFCCLFASFSLHGVWSVCPRKCRSRDFCNSLGAIGTNAEGEGLGTAEVACWVEGESGMEEGRGGRVCWSSLEAIGVDVGRRRGGVHARTRFGERTSGYPPRMSYACLIRCAL